MRVRDAGSDRIALEGIDATIAYCLHLVPDLLAHRDQPGTRERFYPDPVPNSDPRNAEWHRLVDGDLHHLFATAGDVLQRDLARLDVERERIEFPAAHLPAWMSAVNQARIVLAERHGFQAEDMERNDFDVADERGQALLEERVLGLVLQLLVEQALGGMG